MAFLVNYMILCSNNCSSLIIGKKYSCYPRYMYHCRNMYNEKWIVTL